MEKLLITNERNSRTFLITDSTDVQALFDSQLSINEESWGKAARWIDLADADSWEISRQDDTQTVNGVDQIHVPNDYSTILTDITAEYDQEIKMKKMQAKKDYAALTLNYINTIIDTWDVSDKLTLLSRSDVQTVLTFLNYGSIEQSKTLCENLTEDALLTSQIKSDVVAFLTDRIQEFNNLTWS